MQKQKKTKKETSSFGSTDRQQARIVLLICVQVLTDDTLNKNSFYSYNF